MFCNQDHTRISRSVLPVPSAHHPVLLQPLRGMYTYSHAGYVYLAAKADLQ